LVPFSRIDAVPHLRPPSIDHGVMSFIWAFVLGVLLWAFMLAVGVSKPVAFIIGVLATCAIFLYVRLYGEDEPRRRRSRP
jgi:peptidoglycan/LPS O-acetylase OafA/YrhL